MRTKSFLKITHRCRLEGGGITENIKFLFVKVAQLTEIFFSLAVALVTPVLKKNWKPSEFEHFL